MAVASVQFNNGNAAGTSIPVSLGSGVTLGNLLVVCLSEGNTVVPGLPARWTQVETTPPSQAALLVSMYYLVVGASDAGATSFSFSLGTSHSVAWTIREWSSTTGWLASPLDVNQQATSAAATAVSTGTTAATAQAAELAVASLGWNSSGQTQSGLTAGYTSGQLGASAGNNSVQEAFQILAATGTQACQVTISTTQQVAGVIGTFMPGPSAGVSYTLQLRGRKVSRQQHHQRRAQPWLSYANHKIETLVDDTSVNRLATLWGASIGTVAWLAGEIDIQLDTSYSSALVTSAVPLYDLTSSSLYLKIAPYQNTSVQTSVQLGTANGFFFGLSGPNFNVTKIVNSVQTAISNITYNSTSMAWWRVRESGGTVFFDTAPDASGSPGTWTNEFNTPDSTFPGFTMGATAVNLFCGDFGTDPTGTTKVFAVNSSVAASIPLTVNAGLAAGIGTAFAPAMGITAGLATGAGTAFAPAIGLTGALAAGTGTAFAPAIGLTAGLATGTGTAFAPAMGLTAGLATGTGGAQQPAIPRTVILATGTGTAGAVSMAANGGLATGTGTAFAPAMGLTPALATGIGTAGGISMAANGGLATGTGTAFAPAMGLTPALATGTGTAFAPAMGLTPALATGTGTAFAPAMGLTPGLATAVGTAGNVSSGLPAVGLATAIATAYAPAIGITAGLASGVGSANSPPQVGITAGLASASGTAFAPAMGITPGLATGTGTAFAPAVPRTTGLATGSGTAASPAMGLTPGLSSGVGTSFTLSFGNATSPALIASGFGIFPQVPANSIIESVIAEIYQYGSDASVGPPSYQLWDGASAQIGASVNGSQSATPGNFDLVVFTGVSYSQLATLQLQVFGVAPAGDHGATVNVDAVGLSVLWLPHTDASATPSTLQVTPVFPPVTASGVVNATTTASLLAVVPAFPAVQAGFEAGSAAPSALQVTPVFPPVTASGVVNATATASLLAVVPAFPAPQAGFAQATVSVSALAVFPQFPPVTASGTVNATATASLLAVVPVFPAASAGLQNGNASPLALAVVPVFPAVTASGVVNGTATATLLAVVPVFPAITDVTGPPGYTSAQSTPGGGWATPGHIIGPPDGSNAVWTVP